MLFTDSITFLAMLLLAASAACSIDDVCLDVVDLFQTAIPPTVFSNSYKTWRMFYVQICTKQWNTSSKFCFKFFW